MDHWSEEYRVVSEHRSCEVISLLLSVLKVSDSNLGPGTEYPDSLSWFSQALQENAGPLLSTSLPIHNSLIILSLDDLQYIPNLSD
jgi:hypothetical protein